MIPLRFPRTLGARIAGLFAFLLVVVTIAVSVVIREFVRRDLEKGTRDSLLNMQDRMADSLERNRREASLFAELGAQAERSEQNAADRGSAMFQVTLVEETRLRGIRLESVAAGDSRELQATVLQRGFAGMPTVDYVLVKGGAGRVHLVAASPVGGIEKDRRVVTATLPLGREFLRKESRAIGGEVTLLQRGDMLATSSSCFGCTACLRQVMSSAEQWRRMEEGRPIYFTFECNPEPQAVVAVPLRTFDGQTVALALSRSRLNERNALRNATIAVAGIGASITVALVCIFLFLVSRVVRPLRELTRAASAIAEGRYGETVPVRGDDEVAVLSGTFNRMSVSMDNAMREISDWNRLLETRVEEKKRELEEVHLRMIEVERLAAMGQVAAGIAHELNNPLSGMMGYSELGIELFRDRDPGSFTPQELARMRGYFDNICGLTRRCRDIILDMLKFARQPTEEFSLQSLNDLVGETLAFLENQLRQGNVTFRTEYSPALPPFQGNALQMQQVFTNLVMNAAQAMPGGGVVFVRTRRSGERLEAEISDTGSGIPPEVLRRIFDPFFTTKPVGEGTGLGLSVSRSIVMRHGGEISVSSAVGKGSTFTVVLPVSHGNSAAPDGKEKA
ncbi:MAG: HAMP domain-containing protein [Deltaproteobacteria bacterium]|nr:HAMP domain-containing protein [Deltaproteobacteria bacterium]